MGIRDIQLKLREFIKRSKQNKNVRQAAVFSFFSFLNNGIKYLLLIIVAGAIVRLLDLLEYQWYHPGDFLPGKPNGGPAKYKRGI